MNLRPHEQRVVDEKYELDFRIAALTQFFVSSMFANVNTEEQTRLQAQCSAMKVYSDILADRIAAFPPIVGNLPSNVAELRPAPKEAVPAQPIMDVDTFAMLVDAWHGEKFEQGNRLLEIPEGTTITLEDEKTPGETIEMDLNGPYLQVFRVGVLTALQLFKNLPFGASIEEVPAHDDAAS